MDVVIRAFAGSVTGVAPFIGRIEARAVALVAVRASFMLKIQDICVSFGAVAVMTGCAAVIRFFLVSADSNAATGITVSIVRRCFLFHRMCNFTGRVFGSRNRSCWNWAVGSVP